MTEHPTPNQTTATARHDIRVHDLAQEVVSRLAQNGSGGRSLGTSGPPPEMLEAFTALLLDGDAEGAISLLDALPEGCSTYRALADNLFAHAARRLGDAWMDSDLTFLDVNIAISTLLRVNSRAKHRFTSETTPHATRIVFATLPGQAHTLGIIFAAEAFRQAGFGVELMLESSPDAIGRAVRKRNVQLLGLTAGHADRVKDIAAVAERSAGAPQRPAVMLGGAAAQRIVQGARPGQFDCVAGDLSVALRFARRLPGCARTRARMLAEAG